MDTGISPSEQKLRAIMRYAPLGLLEIEEDGRIVNVNLMGDKLLEPISGAKLNPGTSLYPVLDAIHPEITTLVRNFAEPSGLILLNRLYKVEQPSSTEKHFQFTITKMFTNCIIVSIEDMTDKVEEEKILRLAEQDKAIAQGKYEIASEVLHDIGNAVVGFGSHLTRISRMQQHNNHDNFKNVINFIKQEKAAIAGAIGTPKADALTSLLEGIYSAQQDSEEELQRSVNEQLRIVTHIQDILNIQRQYIVGHGSRERKPVGLKEVIDDCRAMVSANLEKKGIELSVTLPTNLVEIKGDRTKLMQVILNILKNSIEAIDMKAAAKKVTVTLTETEQTVKLVISDSGKGLDEETVKHLFERGYTTKHTGSGLGLYNCRSIIESHAGTISMESKGPDMGTETTIEFNK
jgi:signal transduction histidine kinase